MESDMAMKTLGCSEQKVSDDICETLKGASNVEANHDLFAPVRRCSEAPAEQLRNIFVLHRGRRQVARKNLLRWDQSPSTVKRNRPRGDRTKVIIPKSHTPAVRHQLDPWLFRNINSDDRSMIDRPQRDSNRLWFEVSDGCLGKPLNS